jgi:type II secretory pathway pseudopilin PulG
MVHSSKGFTLVELMVAIGITILILGIVLINYRKFDTGIVLTNLAYDVGLSIRKAQTYGISVRGTQIGGEQVFRYPYGIHFEAGTDDNKKVYIIFVDLDEDGVYDCNAADPDNCEKVESLNIQGAYRIKKLCTVDGNTETCSPNAFTDLDITFTRPDPDATIMRVSSGGAATEGSVAKIYLTSNKDVSTCKAIVVRATGQISVPNTPDDTSC